MRTLERYMNMFKDIAKDIKTAFPAVSEESQETGKEKGLDIVQAKPENPIVDGLKKDGEILKAAVVPTWRKGVLPGNKYIKIDTVTGETFPITQAEFEALR